MRTASLRWVRHALDQLLRRHFAADISARVAEVIIWAELRNKRGQGLAKLIGPEPLHGITACGALEVLEKSPVSAVIEAHGQPSFHAAQVATALAIAKARSCRIGLVGLRGFASSTGPLGFYAERIGLADLIGLVFCRSPAAMAPFDLKTALFGTNPLAAAFPSMDEPVVFDMATAATTWSELVLAQIQGQRLSEGIAIDKTGTPTRDPAAAMEGAILPFDRSHKGSGLAMLVDILSGAFIGAPERGGDEANRAWGFTVIALSPALLGETAAFKQAVSRLASEIRALPARGAASAEVPGDSGRRHARDVLAAGQLSVDDEVYELLARAAPPGSETDFINDRSLA